MPSLNEMPNDLPFRPWWWKPKYTGKHRGEYPKKFTPTPGGTIPAVIPYGLRDVKVTPYNWGSGPSILPPGMQTIGFTNEEQYSELLGDDRIIATRSKFTQSLSFDIVNVHEDLMKMLFGEKWTSKARMAGSPENRSLKRCAIALMNYIKNGWRTRH